MSAALPYMWSDVFAPPTALLSFSHLNPEFTIIGSPHSIRMISNMLVHRALRLAITGMLAVLSIPSRFAVADCVISAKEK